MCYLKAFIRLKYYAPTNRFRAAEKRSFLPGIKSCFRRVEANRSHQATHCFEEETAASNQSKCENRKSHEIAKQSSQALPSHMKKWYRKYSAASYIMRTGVKEYYQAMRIEKIMIGNNSAVNREAGVRKDQREQFG